jgi:membrane fusion protein (multidrug efflux system)
VSTIESGYAGGGAKSARPGGLVKPLVILIIVVAIVMGLIFGWHLFIGKMIGKAMSGMASAPQTVSTTVAAETSWQAHTDALGTVRAVRGADLAPQASGVVDTLHMDSGTDVSAGTVLLTLKPNDDPAKLAQLQAQAELAAITLKRDQEQLAAQAISQAVVDTDEATLRSDRAQVAAQQALIAEKTVRAPFSGTLGIRLVDEGQYLAAGTTVVTLQELDPIFIDFYLPQQNLSQLKVHSSVTATIDAYPGVKFPGTITSINPKVDSSSRNVQVRASFDNKDRRLVPGMYANVSVDNGPSVELITLPQSAITYNPYGDTVYLVESDGTVKQRFIKLGETRGDQVAVLSGVAKGDVVVTAGQLKLRNGVHVAVNNAIQPTNQPNPTPPNE